MTRSIQIEIAPYATGPARIVTARSFLVDRFVPDCEFLMLPGKTVQGGRIEAGWTDSSAPPATGRRHLFARRKAPVRAGDRPVFDARRKTPGNWAHFLNNHLPVLFKLCDHEGLNPSGMLVVTPADTPAYVADAAALFGIGIERTDAPVTGRVLDFDIEPWTGLRAARAQWVRSAAVRDLLARGLAAAPPPAVPLPRRVFLSRGDTRRISNEAEIEALLARHGFQKVYPERLSVPDQFRLFEHAEIMVAIHGAGLAPLLYRTEDGLGGLVEILPCGHMTDVYRVMAEQVGCRWIGVRGRIKPAYVEPAYDLGSRFDAFSLDSFEVDPVSLERAIAIMMQPAEGEVA